MNGGTQFDFMGGIPHNSSSNYWKDKVGIHAPKIAFKLSDDHTIGFVEQTFDKSKQQFDRTFAYRKFEVVSKMEQFKNTGEKSALDEKLKTLPGKYEMKGLFINTEKKANVFLRSGGNLLYCDIDEVFNSCLGFD